MTAREYLDDFLNGTSEGRGYSASEVATMMEKYHKHKIEDDIDNG